MKGDAAPNFDEIRALMRELPAPDLEAGNAAATREAQLTKPVGALGRLEEVSRWLSTWQARHPPTIERPRVAVFAGSHGIAAHDGLPSAAEETHRRVGAMIDGGAAVNQLCAWIDADFRVYEMAVDNPTADFTEAAAMSEADCATAMAYGMMAVEEGFDVMALGDIGTANSISAAALSCAFFGGSPSAWLGLESDEDGENVARRAQVVEAGLACHRDALDDPLEALRRLGGLELAAIAGAVIACRMARTPVLLDGFACTAAAAVLYRIDQAALDHCMAAHRADEPGHARLLEAIGKAPLLDLGMYLGEASGAVLAISLLKAACACHNGMATFAQAGISGPS